MNTDDGNCDTGTKTDSLKGRIDNGRILDIYINWATFFGKAACGKVFSTSFFLVKFANLSLVGIVFSFPVWCGFLLMKSSRQYAITRVSQSESLSKNLITTNPQPIVIRALE